MSVLFGSDESQVMAALRELTEQEKRFSQFWHPQIQRADRDQSAVAVIVRNLLASPDYEFCQRLRCETESWPAQQRLEFFSSSWGQVYFGELCWLTDPGRLESFLRILELPGRISDGRIMGLGYAIEKIGALCRDAAAFVRRVRNLPPLADAVRLTEIERQTEIHLPPRREA